MRIGKKRSLLYRDFTRAWYEDGEGIDVARRWADSDLTQRRVSHRIQVTTLTALLGQEAMNSPHLRGELLWIILRRFLHRL
jgi:hypothetical protein